MCIRDRTIATSAAGRAYLAALPEAEQSELLAQIRTESGESWGVIEPGLISSLDEYGALGYCGSFGEWNPHIHAIGFALEGPRGERYSVSCGGPAYLLPKETMVGRIAPLLLETAQRLANETGTLSLD